jgi:glycyl-tRNA synthetase beta chain
MNDLLLEIGCEELPPSFVPPALSQLRDLARAGFEGQRIEVGRVEVMGTPRRLTLIMRDVAERQPDAATQVKGPPVSAAFGGDGAPTKAAEGFARKCGVGVEDLTVRDGYVHAVRAEPGRSTVEVAVEILPGIITGLRFPKTMRWGEGSLRFGRRIAWLLALYGDEPIDFAVGDLASGDVTRGHRFLAPELVHVPSVDAYLPAMEQGNVVLDQDRRREMIREQADVAAETVGGSIPWAEVEALLDEVIYMVELPRAILGGFEERFLALPRCVLIQVMWKHQQYFPVADREGEMMPHFVVIRNGDDRSLDVVRAGNEKVIRARFADAEFFYDKDIRTPLADKVAALEGIVYQEKLGTMRQKADRMSEIASWIAGHAPTLPGGAAAAVLARRAALLAKADLSTRMVIELPSLQGAIGREYALHDGEDPTVADAVAGHYEMCPRDVLSRIVALADRIDALGSHFGIGIKPTGSSDPFGLRRAASGLFAILSEWGIDLFALLDRALDQLEAQGLLGEERARACDEVRSYLGERMEALLMERGARYDVAQAVVAAGFANVPQAIARAQALEQFRAEDADFLPITIAATRIVNILSHARGKGVEIPEGPPDKSRYVEALEHKLDELHAGLLARIGSPDLTDLGGYYAHVYRTLQPLRETIDAYFDKSSNVMVMTDDALLRANRLQLLREINATYHILCDFSKIVQDQ